MKKIEVYIAFNGNCEEAMNFYKSAIGGEIKSMTKFDQAPFPVAEKDKSRVFHSEFQCENVYIMASDGMPDNPISMGDNISLSIAFDNEDEQTKIFDNLCQGGSVTMPLQDTHWNARFGMLKDKFGINWMFNCPKS